VIEGANAAATNMLKVEVRKRLYLLQLLVIFIIRSQIVMQRTLCYVLRNSMVSKRCWYRGHLTVKW